MFLEVWGKVQSRHYTYIATPRQSFLAFRALDQAGSNRKSFEIRSPFAILHSSPARGPQARRFSRGGVEAPSAACSSAHRMRLGKIVAATLALEILMAASHPHAAAEQRAKRRKQFTRVAKVTRL